MLQFKSPTAPKANFDRRSVLKGAAWSVPVIAVAIAAPAAAASVVSPAAGTLTPVLGQAATSVTYAGTPDMAGTAPASVQVLNSTSAAINSNAIITVTITPISSGAAGISVGKIVGGVTSVPGAWDTQNIFTVCFTVPVSLASGASQTFDFDLTSFAHNAKGAHNGQWDYTMSVAVTLGTTTTVSRAATLSVYKK